MQPDLTCNLLTKDDKNCIIISDFSCGTKLSSGICKNPLTFTCDTISLINNQCSRNGLCDILLIDECKLKPDLTCNKITISDKTNCKDIVTLECRPIDIIKN